jgi:N-methylhydantoinase A
MLIADTLKDYVRTVMVSAEQAQNTVVSTLEELEQQGYTDLIQEGIAPAHIKIERYVDLRYVGQSYELTLPFEGDIAKAANDFHTAHERRFGYCDHGEQVQVVNVRLKNRGVTTAVVLKQHELLSETVAQPIRTRQAIFISHEQQPVSYEVPVYERATLQPGATLTGPAIITQYDTTTIVPPSWKLCVDAFENLVIEQEKPTQEQADEQR